MKQVPASALCLIVQLRYYIILLLRQESQSESYLLFLYEEGIQLELRGRQHLAFLW